MILAILLGCVGDLVLLDHALRWSGCRSSCSFILAVILIVISSRMPKKTQLGAEEAAKYRAFRTYLADIDKYENIDAKKDIFQQYLPYAIAFGLEEDYTKKFAQAGSTTPSWFEPAPAAIGGRASQLAGAAALGRSSSGGTARLAGRGESGGSGNSGGGGVDMPDLQDMSDSASRNLGNSSNSLFGMLTAAAAAFAAYLRQERRWQLVRRRWRVRRWIQRWRWIRRRRWVRRRWRRIQLAGRADRIDILGIPIDTMQRSEIERCMVARLGDPAAALLHIATVNPEYVVSAQRDPFFARCIDRCRARAGRRRRHRGSGTLALLTIDPASDRRRCGGTVAGTVRHTLAPRIFLLGNPVSIAELQGRHPTRVVGRWGGGSAEPHRRSRVHRAYSRTSMPSRACRVRRARADCLDRAQSPGTVRSWA